MMCRAVRRERCPSGLASKHLEIKAGGQEPKNYEEASCLRPLVALAALKSEPANVSTTPHITAFSHAGHIFEMRMIKAPALAK